MFLVAAETCGGGGGTGGGVRAYRGPQFMRYYFS